jgi:Protein of unknown function (DUF3108)
MKLGKIIFILLIFSTLAFIQQDPYRQIPNSSFQAGEHFEYKVKYSIFPVGEATVDVASQLATVNNRPCFQINVLGRTTGITDLFHIRNNYRSFVDTSAILPQKFFMSVQENNYKKQETILFDHLNNLAKSEDDEGKTTFKVPDNIHDVISSYYFLRTIDFSKMQVGDVFNTKMFFSDEIYPIRVKFNGRSEVKTKFGKIKVFKLSPMLPENKLFEGEEAIKIWVSDDKNRVPVKIEVEFSVGGASMELRKYSGLKNDFQWF